MKIHHVETYNIQIYIAGDVHAIKSLLARYVFNDEGCVSVTPTTFIYQGGIEEGVCIGLIHYPRFPTPREKMEDQAFRFAQRLIEDLGQWSCSVVTPEKTYWLTRKPENPA